MLFPWQLLLADGKLSLSLSLSRYKLDSRFITRGWIVVFDEIVGTVVWIGV